MRKFPNILGLGVLAVLTACVHPDAGKKAAAAGDQLDEGNTPDGEPLDGDDLGPGVGWDDLMSHATDRFEPNPDIFFEDAVLTPERLARLPHPLRHAPDLAHLA